VVTSHGIQILDDDSALVSFGVSAWVLFLLILVFFPSFSCLFCLSSSLFLCLLVLCLFILCFLLLLADPQESYDFKFLRERPVQDVGLIVTKLCRKCGATRLGVWGAEKRAFLLFLEVWFVSFG
jgi:hypothetical protein